MTREELLKEIEIKCFNKAGKLDGNFHNPKSKSHDVKLIEEINKLTTQFTNISLREQIHILRNNITERPKCYCGNDLQFNGFSKGYKDYCSKKCQAQSPERINKVKEIWKNKTKEEKDAHVRNNKESKLRNHGDPNYNNSKKISKTYKSKDQKYWDTRNEKQYNTKLERYGDKHYCNSEKISESWQNKTDEELTEIKQKKSDTCMDKYGVTHHMYLDETKNKIKQILIKNYGVDHQMRTQEVKDKLQETKTMNGTLQNSTKVLEKAKETNIERYGAITFTASQDGKDQVFTTKLERYGDGNYCNGDKISKSLLSKSDEEWLEIVEQRKQSCLKKYGVVSYSQSYQRKYRYFKDTYNQYTERYKEMNISVITNKEEYINSKFDYVFNVVKLKCNVCGNEWENRLNINGTTSICRVCNPYKFTKEREIGEFLEEFGFNVKYRDRTLIYPYEVDILLNDYKIGVEFNGLMFHSFGKSIHSMFNNHIDETLSKHKHLNKTKMVEEKGYQLFHINEDEWDDKNKQDIWKSLILNKLGVNERIFARKCYIEEIDSKMAKCFLEENHLQGYTNSNIKIGLFYNQELVSVMTFSKPRYNKDVEYELIRFASKKYFNIIGGASKILKYFERKYKPNNLLSYANRRWSTGNVYNKLEFNYIEETTPNYFYFDKSCILESRIKYQKHKLKNILPDYQDSLSESENMYNNDFRKIYDSGNLKYIKEYK